MQRNAYGVAVPALVKEASSPDVFLAYGDTKFHVPSPASMEAMGLRWDKVETLADHSLDDLTRVELGAGPGTKPSAVFPTANPNPYVPGEKPTSSIVRNDVLVAGFVTGQGANWNYDGNTQPFVEDVLYEIVLDVAFIDAMYGPNGLSTALRDARLPGFVNPGDHRTPPLLPFGDLPVDAEGHCYATAGAFVLPASNETGGQWTTQPPGCGELDVKIAELHTQISNLQQQLIHAPNEAKWLYEEQIAQAQDQVKTYEQQKIALGCGSGLCFPTLHMELNCWHVNQQIGTIRDAGGFYRTEARGPAPAGWVNVHENRVVGPFTISTTSSPPFIEVGWNGVATDCWWPFDPNNPDGLPAGPLQPYDNVLVCGTLFQDIAHNLQSGWDTRWAGDGGWLEIHPIDWMHRFKAPPATRTVHTVGLGTQTSQQAASGAQIKQADSGVMLPLPRKGQPDTGQTPAGPPTEFVDPRFTTGAAEQILSQHQFGIDSTSGRPHINLALKTSAPPASNPGPFFKATYVVNWTLPQNAP